MLSFGRCASSLTCAHAVESKPRPHHPHQNATVFYQTVFYQAVCSVLGRHTVFRRNWFTTATVWTRKMGSLSHTRSTSTCGLLSKTAKRSRSAHEFRSWVRLVSLGPRRRAKRSRPCSTRTSTLTKATLAPGSSRTVFHRDRCSTGSIPSLRMCPCDVICVSAQTRPTMACYHPLANLLGVSRHAGGSCQRIPSREGRRTARRG